MDYNHQDYIDSNKLNNNLWRLPTVSELQEAFDYELGKPKIEGFASSNYWSSTTHASYTSYAWFVGFDYGYSDYGSNKTYEYYVRYVRAGQKELEWSESSSKPMTWKEAIEYAKTLQ